MQKNFLIAIALVFAAASAQAQNTTYGGGNAPYLVDGGYISDYSAAGTIVLADGSVTLSNNATYEHGNNLLQNNGSWTAASNSLDLFLSTGSNTISGSAAPTFHNVHFNTGAGTTMAITNTQGISIAGQAQFSNGITTTVRSNTNSGSVKFADNATYTGGTTDVQHVNGYVSKTGNDAFTFPVGSGTDIRALSISAPASATNQYSVAWIAGDPGTNGDPSNANAMHPTNSVTTPITSVSTAGQWDWIPVSGTGAGLTVTVSMPNLTPTGISAPDLRLVGWNGTSWINLSSVATATGTNEGATLSGTLIAGITAIGIGSIGTPLPVLFSRFDVAHDGCKALLSWSTTMEHNNDHFEIERSADGRSFNVIGKVQAAGNSTDVQDYSFTDEHPDAGINYYRIVQIDADGKHNTTTVKAIRFDCGRGAVRVYPTITAGTLYVDMPSGYENARIMLIDIHGRQVRADIPKDGLVRVMRLSSLAAGAYLLKIEHDNRLETFKILYQP
ncbi:T9SS type A sorting domain-containing protein [Taibaiella chishuiensis]|uniref:Putative secreted protein (Por secretion system target) n=1 Tax=Taibaiella chishuiensis TaxID=1434707 RepID=A0A2P8D208_9BACT|nr:T9SS type A sorting domain-containing protein [Taibaiella chishuiensis]PSK91263.1 putative secreted protein (Por secretion system target) [Taibaiella chishuiensis]